MSRRAARFQEAVRNQPEFRVFDLEAGLPDDHPARMVWAYVERMDLSTLYGTIASVEGGAGRAPIDPKILLSLWLYATIDGVGSARRLDGLCTSHIAYQWLCGGVGVNYHTLSDFRSLQGALLDTLLTHSVAVLLDQKLVTLQTVAQDGTRVRASAGASSYRRSKALKKCYEQAKAQVEVLKAETKAEIQAVSKRERAARERAAKERLDRVERAIERCEELQEKARKNKNKRDPEDVRVSTTDPEVSRMKMPDGGHRPAVNVQFASTPDTQVIVGVDAVNVADSHQAAPMYDQIKERYGRGPDHYLVDGGFATRASIDAMSQRGCTVYAPVRKPINPERYSRYERRYQDSDDVAAWRTRMSTDKGKERYKERSQCECINAHVKNRGLTHVLVRGIDKIRSVALLHAVAHNMMRTWKLAPEWA